MIIRPATTKDFKSIKALIARHPQRLIQTSLPKSKEFFVAEAEGKIIACCALQVYSRRLAEVRSLVVDEAYRNQGIATQLVKRCVKKAKTLRIHELLTITGVMSLFAKQGFHMFNKEKYALIKLLD